MTAMSSCWGTDVSDVFVEQDRGPTNRCIVLSKHFVLAGRAGSMPFTFCRSDERSASLPLSGSVNERMRFDTVSR